MCIKSYRVSSLASQTKTSLNPCAQEWRPSSHNQTPPLLPHVLFTPPHYELPAAPLPPPAAAVQFLTVTAGVPPQELMIACEPPQLSFCHSLPLITSVYHQCFHPYLIPSAQPEHAYYHTTSEFFPANGYFHKAETTPFLNLGEKYVESPPSRKMDSPIEKSPKCPSFSNGRKRCSRPSPRRAIRSFSLDTQRAYKQEWRPKRAYSDNGVPAGGAAARSPVSVGPFNDKFTPSPATTVMIKNIPNQLRRDYMLEFLDLYCYEYSLEYDFLYLPMDFRKKDNLGYAFVNFTSAGDAEKFKKILQNYEWGTVNTGRGLFKSNKVCEITWARIQGKQGQLDKFRNSKFECDKLDFLPVVLDPPRNGSDPKPAPPVVLGKLQKRASGKMYY